MARKGTYAAAAEQLRALEAQGGPIVTPEVCAAIWKVDQSLPVAERMRAEAIAQAEAGGGYERVVALSREIVEAGLSFADIGPEDVVPPDSWIAQWGADGAAKRFRLAKAAWMPGREAPVAMSIATDVLKMDARVKAAAKDTRVPQLNIAIQMNITPREYPEIVEGDE